LGEFSTQGKTRWQISKSDSLSFVNSLSNPGSYAFLNSERPYLNESCSNFDEWPYGIGGDTSEISNYARAEIRANKQAVIDRFRSRKVYYALGLLDNGPGDTFCQVSSETRLERSRF